MRNDGQLLSPCQLTAQRTNLVAEGDESNYLVECSVQMTGNDARFFKATAEEDVSHPWVIYAVWVRSIGRSR